MDNKADIRRSRAASLLRALQTGTLVVLAAVLSACGGGGDSSAPAAAAAAATPDTTPPMIVTTLPANGQQRVGLTTTVVATASEAIDAASLNSAVFTLAPSVGGANVPGSIDVSGNTATFTPFFPLAASTQYTATITANVRDAAGNPLPASYVWNFTTVTVPGAPVIGSAVATAPATAVCADTTGSATVNFSAPADDGGATITEYTVTSSPGNLTATSVGPAASPITINNLVVCTPYTFSVTATNSVGISVPSANSTPPVTPSPGVTPPGVPAAVTATAGDTTATVNFTAPSGSPTSYTAAAYTGCPAACVFTGITASGAGTSILVPGLINGTAYTFTVMAFNAAGAGSPSAQSSPAVTPAGAPGAPIGPVASASAPPTALPGQPLGQATVTFGAPASNGGSTITGYTVTAAPGGNSASSVGALPPPGGIVVSGLLVGTPYVFTVTATNGVPSTSLPSANSNSVTPTPAVTLPNAPAAPVAVPGNAQVSVSFTPLTAPADGNSPIISYTVTSTPSGITATGGGSPIVVSVLNGVPYTFTVKARNSVGTGADSAASNTVTPATAPDAPTIGTATAGNGQATVKFTAPAANGGSAITGYTITASDGSTTPFLGAVPPPGGVVVSVTNGITYTFSVTATNSGVQPGGPPLTSTPSASSNPVTPTAGAAPTQPQAVSAANGTVLGSGAAQATVTFGVPVSDGGSVITGYTVTPYIGPTAQTGLATSSVGALPPPAGITVPGLTLGTAYTFTVKATNGVGTGPESTASNVMTPLDRPVQMAAPTATAGDTQATVSFAQLNTAPGNGGSPIQVNGYTVTPYIGAVAQTLLAKTGSSSPITLTGLANTVPYTFRVKATNAIGTGLESVDSNSVTPQAAATVPVPPVVLTAVNSTVLGSGAAGAEATVTFTTPANGGSAITGYTVIPYIGATAQLGLAKSSVGPTAPPAGIKLTGLTLGTTYTFTVTATNSVGTSPESGASLAVTPADRPVQMAAPTATAGSTQATVSFAQLNTSPGNGGSPIQVNGYTVTPYIGAVAQTLLAKTGSSSPITVIGLTNNQPYTFRVTATNAIGTSTDSPDSNGVTPTAATVPTAPTITGATPGNQSAQVFVTLPAAFTAPVCVAPACSPIVGYTVTSIPAGGVDQNAGTTGASHLITGLTNGVSYTFTATAVNGVGTSPISAPSSPAVTPFGPPIPPTSVVASVSGLGQVTLTFSGGSSNGSPVTYTVFSKAPAPAIPLPVPTGTASPITVPGLTLNQAYTFFVTATNAAGSANSPDSNSVTPTAVPPACTAAGVTTNGVITLKATASRTLPGVSPLAVFFDASTTTSTATTKPFHDIEYRWDFGDPGSGSWTATAPNMPNLSRNTARGPVAAHVYEPPAAAFSPVTHNVPFTATVTAFDGTPANTVSCSFPITVQDPDFIFAGTNTICFSTSGSFPAVEANACPSGAQKVTNATYGAVVAFAGAGKRLLLRRGEFWTVGSVSPIANAGPGILGAFGPSPNPPVILATAPLFGAIRLAQPGTALVDWRVMDLELDGGSTITSYGISVPGGAAPPGGLFINKTTLLRLKIHNFNYGINFPDLSSAPPYDQTFVVDSSLFGASSTLAAGGYNAFIAGTNFAFMGNSSVANGSNSNHNMRNPFIGTGLISYNSMTGPATWAPGGETLKIHSYKPFATKFTEKLLISDNILDGDSGIAPQNNVSDERLRDVLIERNWLRGLIYMSGSNFTLRNNICDRTGNTGNVICFQVWHQGIEPVPDQFFFYNNTGFSNTNSTAFRVIQLGQSGATAATNVTVKNNLGYAKNVVPLGSSVLLRDLSPGGSGRTLLNNSLDNQVQSTFPGFVGGLTPSVPNDFKLAPNPVLPATCPTAPICYAKDGGATFTVPGGAGPPVFSDFFGVSRPTGAATDIGATEQ